LELRVEDLEAGRLEDRLEQPPVGAVLGTDVFLEIVSRVPLGRIFRRPCEPGFQDLLRFGRVEVVDEIRSRATPFQKSGSWWSTLRVYIASGVGPACS
jgi:hypothetical protein